MSIFSDDEIGEIEEMLDSVHETFSIPITYFTNKEEVILISNPNHNFLFNGAPTNTTTQSVEVTGVIQARVLHAKKYSVNALKFEGNNLSNILLAEGEIRLKVDVDGHDILKEAKRIRVDGFLCEISSDGRPIGPFSRKYYSYILKPIS